MVKLYNRMVHILSTFKNFVFKHIQVVPFHEKQLWYNLFERFLCLWVPQAPENLKFLSNFGIFGIVTLIYFLIKDCNN